MTKRVVKGLVAGMARAVAVHIIGRLERADAGGGARGLACAERRKVAAAERC